jgi:hypothetical protein
MRRIDYLVYLVSVNAIALLCKEIMVLAAIAACGSPNFVRVIRMASG